MTFEHLFYITTSPYSFYLDHAIQHCNLQTESIQTKNIRYRYHSFALLTIFLEIITDNAISALALTGYTANWLTGTHASLPVMKEVCGINL